MWETLEEATRPHVDEMKEADFDPFFMGWASQFKGSNELQLLMHYRMAHFNFKFPTTWRFSA